MFGIIVGARRIFLIKFQYYHNDFLASKLENNQSIHPYLKKKNWNEQAGYIVLFLWQVPYVKYLEI